MSKSYSQSELIKHVNLLKVTLPRMHKLGIPVTPENYAVWYTYSHGIDLDLNKQIDEYLNQGLSFSLEINAMLYEKYIAQQLSNELKEAQNTTKLFLHQLVEKMESMSTGSSRFGKALKDCEQLLVGKPTVNQLTEIVGKITLETEIMNTSNQEMINTLESMKQEIIELKAGVENLTETIHTDPLTEIANRRAFDEKLEELFKNINNENFSLLMIDIDHFKEFNDVHGHAHGDKVLIFVAKALNKTVSSFGMAARYGGEEFVILLPKVDNKKAMSIAEKLRQKIAEKRISSVSDKVKVRNITISIGVATATIRDDIKGIVERADKAMYLSKKQGRNKVSNEYDF